MQTKEQLQARIGTYGQGHLIAFWEELDADQRQSLAEQISQVDFVALQQFVTGSDKSPDWSQLARGAKPPRAIRLQATGNEIPADAARRRGETALRQGKVGMILVAGGQGTRLGWDHPKGLFPIGPVSRRTIFQVLVDRLRAIARRYRTSIPLYVMTSPATHEATIEYFQTSRYLGLRQDEVRFFCQGMLPAVDQQTGRILLADRGSLALSPDGHGGMLTALAASGCLADAQSRGLELFFYGQVDNPLLQVCDPEFLGFHLLADSEMTTQVVQKRFALERVGNVVEINGQTSIIEYSDLPDEVAHQRIADGSLYLWAGNIAVHAFSLDFLIREASDAMGLPIHRAMKKVPFVNERGQAISPSSPNAVKFERFIFDMLPKARQTMVVEVDAAEAFAPVKNASTESVDTPETSRAAMILRDKSLLRAGGLIVHDGVPVEVNPLWAIDAEEVVRHGLGAWQVASPRYFHSVGEG